ncbi:hypothetical protein CsSME_00000120 [Camellia sinensis var. sinensis]
MAVGRPTIQLSCCKDRLVMAAMKPASSSCTTIMTFLRHRGMTSNPLSTTAAAAFSSCSTATEKLHDSLQAKNEGVSGDEKKRKGRGSCNSEEETARLKERGSVCVRERERERERVMVSFVAERETVF